jgi:hypothetical protein
MGLAFFQKESAHAVGLSTYWDLLGKERIVRSGWLLSPRRHYFDHVSPVLQSTSDKGLVSLVSVRKIVRFVPRSPTPRLGYAFTPHQGRDAHNTRAGATQ